MNRTSGGTRNEPLQALKFLLPALYCCLFVLISAYQVYFLFLALPLLTGILTAMMGEFTEDQLRRELHNYNSNPYISSIKCLTAITFILMTVWSLDHVWHSFMSIPEFLLFAFMFGAISGVLGFSLLHELSHAKSGLMRLLSKILSVMMCFPFFRSDHLYSHHQLAATTDDFTTARQDQHLYAYLVRLVTGRLRQSYTFNNPFPEHKKKSILIENAVTLFIMLLFLAALCLVSLKLCVFMLLQCFIASFLYNTSNYIQHYGLTRQASEPFSSRHAWNSYYRYFSYLTFMMPVHAQHHIENADENHVAAKTHRMPFPYILMFLLACVPGLWFRKMNPLIEYAITHPSPLRGATVWTHLFLSFLV